MSQYIKLAFINPLGIVKGKNMSFNTFFKIFFLLVCIFLLPTLMNIPQIFGQFQNDIAEVNEKIPEFEVQDGVIFTDENDYIHLTDSAIFYFDPNNALYDDGLIERNVDLGFAPLNIALTNDKLLFYVSGIEQGISYVSIPDFSYDTLTMILESLTKSNLLVLLLTVVLLFMISSLLLLYQLALIILTNYLISIFQSTRFKMGEVAKISILSITLPAVALTIARLLNISTVYSLQLFTLFSTLLFLLAILRHKKILKGH